VWYFKEATSNAEHGRMSAGSSFIMVNGLLSDANTLDMYSLVNQIKKEVGILFEACLGLGPQYMFNIYTHGWCLICAALSP
jgi:hypothetical protein